MNNKKVFIMSSGDKMAEEIQTRKGIRRRKRLLGRIFSSNCSDFNYYIWNITLCSNIKGLWNFDDTDVS